MDEAKRLAEQRAEEMRQKVQRTRDEAQKAEEDFKNYIAQRRAEMEERRKQMEQRIQEEKERWRQIGEQGITIGLHYGDPTKSKKRRQNNISMLPFEAEIMDICVTCGCNIF
jgi:hypothetical protein